MTLSSLVASDLHISERIWGELPGVRGDAFHALNGIYQLAMDHRVASVVLAGDIFDSPRPSSSEVQRFRTFVADLAARDIQVQFVEGQHDRSSRREHQGMRVIPWASLADRARPVHECEFDLAGLRAWGLDYQAPDELPFAVARIPEGVEVLVGHQRWLELHGGSCDPSLTSLHRVNILFTGDLHRHLRKDLVMPDGRFLQVYSPGSTHMRSVDEPPQKFVYLVRPGGENNLEVTSLPLSSRPVRRYQVADEGELDALVACLDEVCLPGCDLPADLVTPVVEIRYSAALHSARVRLKSLLGSRVHLLLRRLAAPGPGVAPVAVSASRPKADPEIQRLVEARCQGDRELAALALDLMTREAALVELENRVTQRSPCEAGQHVPS